MTVAGDYEPWSISFSTPYLQAESYRAIGISGSSSRWEASDIAGRSSMTKDGLVAAVNEARLAPRTSRGVAGVGASSTVVPPEDA